MKRIAATVSVGLILGSVWMLTDQDTQPPSAHMEADAQADIARNGEGQSDRKAQSGFGIGAIQTQEDILKQSQPPKHGPAHVTLQEYTEQSVYGEMPRKLAGVAPPALLLDENGQLIVDQRLKDLIEFFLILRHDEGLDVALARIREYFRMVLPADSVAVAETILDGYMAYEENLPEYNVEPSHEPNQMAASVRSMLDEKKALRREYLGAEYSEALFGQDERYADFAYERMVLKNNTELSEQERNTQLAALENNLPPTTKERVRRQRLSEQATRHITELRKQGASAEELHAARTQYYGEKVADRYAFLESSSSSWQQRVDSFQQQKRLIEQQYGLTPEQKKQQVQNLAEANFNAKERFKLVYQQVSKIAEAGASEPQSRQLTN